MDKLHKLELKLDPEDDDDSMFTLSKGDIKNIIAQYGTKAQEIKVKTGNYIIKSILSALAFVIALSWRDAIRKTIDAFVVLLGIPDTAFFYEIVISLIVTVICVMGIVMFSKIQDDQE